MTTPEHIREEAIIPESIWNDAEKIAAAIGLGSDPWDGLSATIAIATALLAAEKWGMERAAGIADAIAAEKEENAPFEDTHDLRDRMLVYAKHIRRAAAAIRKAREERG